jgi:hypothetical protein
MSRKRLLISLACVAALAAFSMTPALAQAGLLWHMNGPVLRLGSNQNVVLYGTMTISGSVLGEIKCDVLEGGAVRNESEKGLADIEGYTTYDCTSSPNPCPGVLVTAEMPVEVTERLNPKSEKEKIAQHGPTTLPWSGELVEEEATEKRKKFKINGVKLTVVAPCFSLEVPSQGTLEPYVINGTKNGLKPTNLEFPGKGGLDICEGGKCREVESPGSLALVGTSVQLVTAE